MSKTSYKNTFTEFPKAWLEFTHFTMNIYLPKWGTYVPNQGTNYSLQCKESPTTKIINTSKKTRSKSGLECPQHRPFSMKRKVKPITQPPQIIIHGQSKVEYMHTFYQESIGLRRELRFEITKQIRTTESIHLKIANNNY